MWGLLFGAAALAWYFGIPRRFKNALNSSRSAVDFAIIGLAVVGAFCFVRGNWIFAIICGGSALGMLYGRPPTPARRPGASEPEAYAILGLDAAATATDVHAAWRRLIAQVHPDAGGSNDLARRVTAARDLLLARLEPR